ncbi:MAG: DUF4363 family protein [Clostridia bacterium]|nr:DUF4363 family protein [Clostridia bacterium]
MKRVYISLIILVSIVVLSIFSYCCLSRELDFIKEELIDCIELTDDTTVYSAKIKADEIYERWQINSKKLELVIPEDVCNELSLVLEDIKLCFADGKREEAKQKIKKAIYTVDTITDREKLSLEAIL